MQLVHDDCVRVRPVLLLAVGGDDLEHAVQLGEVDPVLAQRQELLQGRAVDLREADHPLGNVQHDARLVTLAGGHDDLAARFLVTDQEGESDGGSDLGVVCRDVAITYQEHMGGVVDLDGD